DELRRRRRRELARLVIQDPERPDVGVLGQPVLDRRPSIELRRRDAGVEMREARATEFKALADEFSRRCSPGRSVHHQAYVMVRLKELEQQRQPHELAHDVSAAVGGMEYAVEVEEERSSPVHVVARWRSSSASSRY